MRKAQQDREHAAVLARRALLEIAITHSALARSLGRASSASTGRVTGTPEPPLPFRESVSQMLGEIAHLGFYLTQRLVVESSGRKAPVLAAHLPPALDERLVHIARHHIGHFVPADDFEGRAFAQDLEQLAQRAENAAYPSGSRDIDVPNRADEAALRRDLMPCAEPDCKGHYKMRVSVEPMWGITVVDPTTWPPLTCSTDRTHVVTGRELALAVQLARAKGTTHLDELRRGRVEAAS